MSRAEDIKHHSSLRVVCHLGEQGRWGRNPADRCEYCFHVVIIMVHRRI